MLHSLLVNLNTYLDIPLAGLFINKIYQFMQNNSILTKGRAICLVLDSARHLLAELPLDNEVVEATQKDCGVDMLTMIVQIATISCGVDEWTEVYAFLLNIGISVPDDFNLKMNYMESVSDLLPSDGRHN